MMSLQPEIKEIPSLSAEAMNQLVEEAKVFFRTVQPVASDLYDNLERWLPCIEAYHIQELSQAHHHTIRLKINYLLMRWIIALKWR